MIVKETTPTVARTFALEVSRRELETIRAACEYTSSELLWTGAATLFGIGPEEFSALRDAIKL